MTRTRPITLALAALSLSVALAGCGETDATAGAEPTASSAGASDEAAGESGDETGDETTEDGSTVTKDEPIGDTPIQTGPAGEASLPLGAVPDAIVQRDDDTNPRLSAPWSSRTASSPWAAACRASSQEASCSWPSAPRIRGLVIRSS